MATKTVHTCDRCEREIQKGLYSVVHISRASLAEHKPPQEFSSKPHDLCGFCKDEYKRTIEQFMVAPKRKQTKFTNLSISEPKPIIET